MDDHIPSSIPNASCGHTPPAASPKSTLTAPQPMSPGLCTSSSGWLSFPLCATSTSTFLHRYSAFLSPTTRQSLHPSLAASSQQCALVPTLLLPSTGYTTWECTPLVFVVQVAIPHDNAVVPFVKFDKLRAEFPGYTHYALLFTTLSDLL
ncbi:hypothetical protein BDQ17DRAFT_1426734 [Cyathus striatus]|nr:hypothetical protein BDQ17DRAFT_1426734 [Cyathus striatus]